MKIFTIARVENKCYGHGDYGDEEIIARVGGYGTGDFPKCFKSREQASNYLEATGIYGGKVVELDLV